MNRRRLLQLTAASLTLGLPRLATAAFEKPLKIIDAHTHFYDPTRAGGVPWPSKTDAVLYRRRLPADYRALELPQPVAGTVVVEASPLVEDNQWILDLAEHDPFIVGLVGRLPVGTPEFRGHLERLAKNPRFRGIRVGYPTLKELSDPSSLFADFKRLSDAGLVLDVNGSPEVLGWVERIARELPSLTIVINHVANVRIDGGPMPDDWRRGMSTAARHEKVFCKVSSLVESAARSESKAPRDAAFYRPVLDAMWEIFGEDRLIYGSNWPVCERFGTCATVQTVAHDYFALKGRTALEKFFAKNAGAAYQWPA